MSEPDVVVGIGGAAGDGTASAGNTLVLSMARQGIAGYSYNSYQSVIRGGHSWLRLRFSPKKPLNQGDQVDVLIALNQDSLDRHLQELQPGGVCFYNGAKFQPSYDPPAGVQLCGLPVPDLAPDSIKLPVMQNTVAVGAAVQGLGFDTLASVFETTFAKKPAVVQKNIEAARNGYDYAAKNFQPLATPLHPTDQKWAQSSGNDLLAMGAALAGCKFYVAYPMSPATHILEWFANHSKRLSICVRQVEDEISVVNMEDLIEVDREFFLGLPRLNRFSMLHTAADVQAIERDYDVSIGSLDQHVEVIRQVCRDWKAATVAGIKLSQSYHRAMDLYRPQSRRRGSSLRRAAAGRVRRTQLRCRRSVRRLPRIRVLPRRRRRRSNHSVSPGDTGRQFR